MLWDQTVGGWRFFFYARFCLDLLVVGKNMQNQPRLKPMRPSGFLGDDSPRAPVTGTISRDENKPTYFYQATTARL